MSAQTARSISQADGLDPLRALQRVLYRSAKQNPARRFHALYVSVHGFRQPERVRVHGIRQPGVHRIRQ